MRKVFDSQMTFGQTPIDQIKLNVRCRDEIPKILQGLQHIYTSKKLREKVFTILRKMVPDDINSKNGRPGMDLWKIFVMGAVRLNCNWDYDKLHDIVNNHKTLRQMLGHGMMDDDKIYPLQTLKDNVALLTPEILDEINTLVVNEGHKIVVKKKDPILTGRCDSFVVETNVHYPTDINLLFDAVRKLITIAALISQKMDMTFWRQHLYNIRSFKKLFRTVQKLKRSTSKDEEKKAKKDEQIVEAHVEYLKAAEEYILKAKLTIECASTSSSLNDLELLSEIEELKEYIEHARRQIDQTRRRVVQKEKIPHKEKVFSIFQTHTEWITKGKAGVPQELGLRVCILEDQYGFILHHRVMVKETDDKVAIPMIEAAQSKFPNLNGCSFDKGFYTPENKTELKKKLGILVLPKKGRRNKNELEEETTDEFIGLKRKHSAVESGINGLENHGLDQCPDHGIDGFKRYVGLSVVARNIQILGHHIQQKKLRRIQSTESVKAAA